jgi:hypothetical protein
MRYHMRTIPRESMLTIGGRVEPLLWLMAHFLDRIFGYRSTGQAVLSLITHVANLTLVFLLIKKLSSSQAIAAAVAVGFALSKSAPIVLGYNVLGWHTGIELLLQIIAILMLIRASTSRRRFWWVAGHLAIFCLALLWRNTSAALAGAVFAYTIFLCPKKFRLSAWAVVILEVALVVIITVARQAELIGSGASWLNVVQSLTILWRSMPVAFLVPVRGSFSDLLIGIPALCVTAYLTIRGLVVVVRGNRQAVRLLLFMLCCVVAIVGMSLLSGRALSLNYFYAGAHYWVALFIVLWAYALRSIFPAGFRGKRAVVWLVVISTVAIQIGLSADSKINNQLTLTAKAKRISTASYQDVISLILEAKPLGRPIWIANSPALANWSEPSRTSNALMLLSMAYAANKQIDDLSLVLVAVASADHAHYRSQDMYLQVATDVASENWYQTRNDIIQAAINRNAILIEWNRGKMAFERYSHPDR